MISGKKILAVISARGGSKGVHHKNIRDAAGKPLIGWTIDEAKKSQYIDRLVLSSEDEKIIVVAKQLGCDVPFVRPAELAQDTTPGVEPVLHAIGQLPDYDYVVLLQPTSPLRTVEDIDGCIAACVSAGSDFTVSVCESPKSPYWMYELKEGKTLRRIIEPPEMATRRQDLPSAYCLNGAVYVARCEALQQSKKFMTPETTAFVMPADRSLDIDSESDFVIFEALIQARKAV